MLAVFATTMVTGCATPGPERTLAGGGPRMIDLYRGTGGDRARDAEVGDRGILRCRMVWNWRLRRRVERCRRSEPPAPTAAGAANPPYTRTAANELELLFPRVPNPDIYIYVYPHLATRERVPVPGYTTAVPLYERVEYALPGDFPGTGGAAWPTAPDVAAERPDREEPEQGEAAEEGEASEGVSAGPDDGSGPDAVPPTAANGGEVEGEDGAVENELEAPAVVAESAVGEDAGERARDARPEPAAPVETGTPSPAEDGPGASPDFAVEPPGRSGDGCAVVDVRRGSLKANVRRLVGECGYRFGEWPGTEEAVVDWVIEEGYSARVDGVLGLLRLLEGYGLRGEVMERQRRVDFRKEAK